MSAVEKEETILEVLESLEPSYEEYDREVSDGSTTMVYTQKPLSYFGKLELFGTLGEGVSRALETGNMSVDSMIAAAGTDSVEGFVISIFKMAPHVPGLIEDLYAILLAVPHGERAWFKDTIRASMDDETGLSILEVGFEQNTEAVRDFFTRGSKTFQKAMEVFQARSSESLKPSKPTPRATRSRSKS